jgi:hypothetical protein
MGMTGSPAEKIVVYSREWSAQNVRSYVGR